MKYREAGLALDGRPRRREPKNEGDVLGGDLLSTMYQAETAIQVHEFLRRARRRGVGASDVLSGGDAKPDRRSCVINSGLKRVTVRTACYWSTSKRRRPAY